MISKKMEKALNEQIKNEMYSASLYLAMSAYCSDQNLGGFANWFRIQAMEEMTHAMKMYDYIFEQNGCAKVPGIDEPPADFKSPEGCFAGALEHEQKVTGWINDLVNLALEEKDHATNIFLQWFVTEQIEEEANALDNLNKVKMVGGKPHGLYMIDRELAGRVFVSPTSSAG